MKKSIFLTLLFTFNVFAGGYYPSVHQGYDPITGLFYYPIKHKPESGGMFSSKSDTRIKNILIFDPETEIQSYLFKTNQVWDIQTFTFETGLNKSNEVQFFNSSYSGLNNSFNAAREIKNKLLVITKQKDSDTLTMWYASKNGKNLKQVYTFDKSVRWHIDIKNSKVRFITHKKDVVFKSIDW